MITGKYKLEKLLYNDLNFVNNVIKIVGDIPFELVHYIINNRFYNNSDFINYFLLNYLFDFSKSCDRFVDIFYVHINRMEKIFNHFKGNIDYDFCCLVHYQIKNAQYKISRMKDKNKKKNTYSIS